MYSIFFILAVYLHVFFLYKFSIVFVKLLIYADNIYFC